LPFVISIVLPYSREKEVEVEMARTNETRRICHRRLDAIQKVRENFTNCQKEIERRPRFLEYGKAARQDLAKNMCRWHVLFVNISSFTRAKASGSPNFQSSFHARRR
jgi:hypothetical protein